MLFDVSRVLSGDVLNEQATISVNDIDSAYFKNEMALELSLPILCECSAKYSAGIVTLSINAPVSYTTPCARCLKELVGIQELELREILVSKLNEEDNFELLEVPDGKVDITQLVFEGLCFELPYRHLCSEDCKGLCPKCGADLNNTSCECSHSEPDPRLAPLDTLLKEMTLRADQASKADQADNADQQNK